MNNVYVYQLDAIPTVGFSDPILSYFSALRFSLDGIRMLKEGYKKVFTPFFQLCAPKSITFRIIDTTRSIQNCRFSEMGGAGCRIRANRRYQEGPRRCPVCPRTKHRSKFACTANLTANTHQDYLVPPTRIHARLVEHERRVPYRDNTL